MTQRRQVLKDLHQARREVRERHVLAKELKRMITTVCESSPESDAKEELIERMINLETAERINQIKLEMARTNQEEQQTVPKGSHQDINL